MDYQKQDWQETALEMAKAYLYEQAENERCVQFLNTDIHEAIKHGCAHCYYDIDPSSPLYSDMASALKAFVAGELPALIAYDKAAYPIEGTAQDECDRHNYDPYQHQISPDEISSGFFGMACA